MVKRTVDMVPYQTIVLVQIRQFHRLHQCYKNASLENEPKSGKDIHAMRTH